MAPPGVNPDPAPHGTRVVQGAIEKSNVTRVAEMARMIEITRSYTDIAAILQQQSDQRSNALQQLSQTPSSSSLRLRRHDMRALDTAATGMAAMDLQVQVIAGNIANMTTTGFKSQRAEFQDLIYEHVQRIGAQASDKGNILPVGIELGSGVKTVGTPRLMTQGTLAQTGNTLDVAIQGTGWFKILMPDGTFSYTRDGSFQMDAQGRIVTAEGNLVQPTITIPPNSTGLTINQQGQVSVTLPGSTTSSILGQFTMTTFINDAGLQANGNNLFIATPASGTPQDGIARHQQRRHAAARQPRTVERRGGDRNLQPDRGAARLRDEFQGHHRGRRDAADHLATDALRRTDAMIRSSLRRLALALPLAGLLAAPAAAQNAVPALRANVTVTGDDRAHRRSGRECRRRSPTCRSSARPISAPAARSRPNASSRRSVRISSSASTPAASPKWS